MKITGIPALVGSYDNFIWILQHQQDAWIIDPGESQGVLDYLSQNNLTPKAIFITHNHFDHVEGIPALQAIFPDIDIYGPAKANHPLIQFGLQEGDTCSLTEDFALTVMETPGHTLDHISYYNQQTLFCGDTLFTAGCGRELGGGYENFAQSILKLRTLPDALEFYSAHEYTQDNLAFAHHICPEDPAIAERFKSFSLPFPRLQTSPQSTLGIEKHTNPFLQFDQPKMRKKLQQKGANTNSNTSLFKTLRDWKDDIDQNGFPEKKQNV